MTQYKIEFTSKASEDLSTIYRYIKYNLNEPIIARKILRCLEDSIKQLENFANIYPVIIEKFSLEIDLRKKSVKNYIIFFSIENKTVYIIRILHNKRNWRKILKLI